jgi:hypothetical protein
MKIRCGCFLIAALLYAAPARAGLLVAVQSVSAGIGSTGNGFDVTLMNTGAAPLTVGGFNFTISTADSEITFTSADISTTTAPYIFAGDSLFGPTINTTSGQSLAASDLAISGGDVVGAGATVGLGHVLFDISPTAALGSFPVVLAPFPGTSLADSLGNNITINTLTNGQITIIAATVPEPGSIVLLGSVLLAVILAKRRARRRAC